MRVNFAPHCDRRVPHLRRANCGLAFLFGTKFPPQSATRCSAFFAYRLPFTDSGRGAPERKDKKNKKDRKYRDFCFSCHSCHSCHSCPTCPSCFSLFTGIFFNTRKPKGVHSIGLLTVVALKILAETYIEASQWIAVSATCKNCKRAE